MHLRARRLTVIILYPSVGQWRLFWIPPPKRRAQGSRARPSLQPDYQCFIQRHEMCPWRTASLFLSLQKTNAPKSIRRRCFPSSMSFHKSLCIHRTLAEWNPCNLTLLSGVSGRGAGMDAVTNLSVRAGRKQKAADSSLDLCVVLSEALWFQGGKRKKKVFKYGR